ncbi:PadR family transcriptional regulator [Salinispira pacifica]|uniref:Transcriptional regulator, PadR family n=1 Tax=Salinispira pacifica TaxID=1307761 RepID=V5WLZ6_9SPIO|nr:PadR family transcriptional regulator [Salinispira pacifica]AHC16121.1 Transcriptional regulator, PadR family [Salinispira pacifica]
METGDSRFQNLVQELRRGSLVLAVLHLSDAPSYGYALVERLKQAGIGAEKNTLYPLLRRLEQQGLMESSWDTGEARPRKYYRITDEGRETRQLLKEEWNEMSRSMDRILTEEE